VHPNEIEAALREIAVAELGIAATEIEERVAALDSLERMQLAMAVEDHFKILLRATDEAELTSLRDLAALVASKLASESP
jgi:acyl carrier protein